MLGAELMIFEILTGRKTFDGFLFDLRPIQVENNAMSNFFSRLEALHMFLFYTSESQTGIVYS